ncbi:MAG: phosphoribosylglycinamide formyltransferase-1 [Halieaceae bacterium]|jgi:phosphoribosylglycinamide formyltransferase-1
MKIAVLISGSGSNLQALIDAVEKGELSATIALVISNNPDAGGLDRARLAGIDCIVVNHRCYASREHFDQALLATLAPYSPDLILLAGFMRILTADFIGNYHGKLLNIHPSLLPKYPGLHTHQRAIDNGDSLGGATVHFVTVELDGGPPIIQARVSIEDSDDATTLAERVLIEEHKIYTLAARWFCAGRLALSSDKATLDGTILADTGVVYSKLP